MGIAEVSFVESKLNLDPLNFIGLNLDLLDGREGCVYFEQHLLDIVLILFGLYLIKFGSILFDVGLYFGDVSFDIFFELGEPVIIFGVGLINFSLEF